jgi:hypothetical protein
MSHYTDANISLKEITLTQFELAREVPAAIDLFAEKPENLGIQVRTLLIKLNAALTNFKLPKITVGIGIEEYAFFSPLLTYMHGSKTKDLKIFSHNPTNSLKKTIVPNEVISKMNSNHFLNNERDISNAVLKEEGFLILLLSVRAVNEAREFIDALSTNKSGLLLIHNYSLTSSPSHHLYAAERELRLLELPDGSGECYSIR